MENLLAAYAEGEDDEVGEEEQVTEASINLKRSRAYALEGKHADTSPDKRATLAATKTKKARVSEGAKPVVLLPPPPADLFGGGSSPNEAKDSPAAHLGRVRSFPHIEGNYPTFVYIPGTLARALLCSSCSPMHSPPTHIACRPAVYITTVDGLMPCADRLLQQFRDWYLVCGVSARLCRHILMCAGCPADRSTPSASCGMKAAATSRAAAGRWS
jgi:hypothetical protein